MRDHKLLLIGEDSATADGLNSGLGSEGFEVVCVGGGSAGLARVALHDVDALLLAVGGSDGVELLGRARSAGRGMPILVLMADDALGSRVAALEGGADDCLAAPFAFEELLARVRALLRRAASPRWAPLAYAGIVVSPHGSGCIAVGRPVALSPRERALLELFLRRRGETLGRREILRDAFGYDFDPGTNIVDVHVGHLRKKLEGVAARLESVRGSGYRLIADDEHAHA